jgi:hypothetical protein
LLGRSFAVPVPVIAIIAVPVPVIIIIAASTRDGMGGGLRRLRRLRQSLTVRKRGGQGVFCRLIGLCIERYVLGSHRAANM